MTKIIRTYRCLECGHRWKLTFHLAGEAYEVIPDPDCPKCANVPQAQAPRITAPSIVTTKGRAVDTAWQIAQEDYGLTNMRDNAKEGETAFIPPPTEAPNPATITRPQMLWGGAAPARSPTPMPGQAALMAGARTSAAIAKAEDRNPLTMLHRQRPKLQAVPVNKS